MEQCVKQGYAKSIGVSNFNSVQIDRIYKIATVKPVVNQVSAFNFITGESIAEKYIRSSGMIEIIDDIIR